MSQGIPSNRKYTDSLAIPALPNKFLGQSLNFNHLLPPYYLHQYNGYYRTGLSITPFPSTTDLSTSRIALFAKSSVIQLSS